MAKISITIDGKQIIADDSQSILSIARSNGVFVPAICYLNNCSPTLACRLCLVEADGKRVYACNAKVKDGMNVITNNEEIKEERRSIMEAYDVNHPLACGVCDQSGECELQNYTLEMGVDKQHLCTPDTHRPSYDWGFVHYDSSLCIVCERCVKVCKDMIGDAGLKTISRGGEALDKEWKDKMPKDAYAVWNRMQKSIIGRVDEDEDFCGSCGECAAVCPVGALVFKNFQYRSNAWELRKIPATNPHSSDCSLMYYEVKQDSIKDNEEKIYRVSSDFNFAPLNGAARFAYDFENRVEQKDEKTFNELLNLFKNNEIDFIKFNSFITNEEAFILQQFKEKFGIKLINEDALNYQNFLKEFSKTSGKSLYTSNSQKLRQSDFTIVVGSFLRYDAPNCGYLLNNALSMNKGAGLYFHPIFDKGVEKYAKNFKVIKHKAFYEEAILLWILDFFGENLPNDLSSYLQSFKEKKLKIVEQTQQIEVSEEVKKTIKDEESGEEKEITEIVKKMIPKKVQQEIEVEVSKLWEFMNAQSLEEEISSMLAKKEKFTLVVGEDLYTHKNAKNLANLLGLIEKFTKFEIFIIPSQTNTLGVSLICDLDESANGFGLGYNEKSNFTLAAFGEKDLDIPALNQQEGTFVNYDKRLVPTNAALNYYGYCLNDIANALGFDEELTINYTSKLPKQKGFKQVEFDDLPNEFLNSGFENRGYLIENYDVQSEISFSKFEEIKFDDNIIYRANPILQFNAFTNEASQTKQKAYLYISSDFAEKNNIKDFDVVEISNSNSNLKIEAKIDKAISGDIPYLPNFDKKLNSDEFFKDGYRFVSATIKRIQQ